MTPNTARQTGGRGIPASLVQVERLRVRLQSRLLITGAMKDHIGAMMAIQVMQQRLRRDTQKRNA